MSSDVSAHLIYRLNNAAILQYPFPHAYVENVFPEHFFRQLRANWPHAAALTSLAETGRVSKGAYRDRYVLPFTPDGIERMAENHRPFWSQFGSWFMSDGFLQAVVHKFEPYIRRRFADKRNSCQFEADALLVRDRTNYAIGPHTDAPHRLLSMLFYCPDNASKTHLGTSIYVPKDPAFRCKGGPHHPHSKFVNVVTMEYKPNSLFAFFKTDNSFHGVEPIEEENVERDLLLYDIRVNSPERNGKSDDHVLPGGLARKMLGNMFNNRN